MAPEQRIFSIQSHVVSGYVGNKAAVFPLQLLGFDVDVVNSVHFSNHTGYPGGIEGDILKGEQLRSILDGLKRNDLLNDIGHILTGYIGSESFLEAVLDVVRTIREHNSNTRFVCDPVLGDKGEFYVPESLVKVYKEKVIPIADVITPNQFEVEQLTGIATKTIEDAIRACGKLHEMGPKLVFITSMVLENGDIPPDNLAILASERAGDKQEIWQIDCPILPGQFTGTGDVTAALLLAHTATESRTIPAAMEKVINTMFAMLELTNESSGDTVKSRELKLIKGKGIIENPPSRFKSKKIL